MTFDRNGQRRQDTISFLPSLFEEINPGDISEQVPQRPAHAVDTEASGHNIDYSLAILRAPVLRCKLRTITYFTVSKPAIAFGSYNSAGFLNSECHWQAAGSQCRWRIKGYWGCTPTCHSALRSMKGIIQRLHSAKPCSV